MEARRSRSFGREGGAWRVKKIHIPVGTSEFREIREEGYYYIDKSDMIRELLQTIGTKVTLITRPRRFGKTLGMNMLSEFFDIRKDSRKIFEGLAISEEGALCEKWMNSYPTIFISFKSVDGLDFSGAYAMLEYVISEAYKEHIYLLQSDKLDLYDKKMFDRIASRTAQQSEVMNGLLQLTRMLAAHYGRSVILLIDEYDVPLAKASDKGYYAQMLNVIRGLIQVIKDNPVLKFAVITGCLQIAKESIFTGTNNFVSDTISDTRLNEYFGFTQKEVSALLHDMGLQSHAAEMKEWYDGYCFGEFDVYCPWDVMNYVKDLLLDGSAKPRNYWENTSDNAIIRTFLDKTDIDVRDEFEVLLSGGCIREALVENLSYDTLGVPGENLWSILYLTGYLTRVRAEEQPGEDGKVALKIPNREIRGIFKNSVKAWFTEKAEKSDRKKLFAALWAGETESLTQLISDLLFNTISYHDYRESFYHAFLVGLLSNAGYQVESNYESGLGRADIIVKDRQRRRAVVIETKWVDDAGELEKACAEALRQIENRQYARKVENAGYRQVVRLGIAFCGKECLVRS